MKNFIFLLKNEKFTFLLKNENFSHFWWKMINSVEKLNSAEKWTILSKNGKFLIFGKKLKIPKICNLCQKNGRLLEIYQFWQILKIWEVFRLKPDKAQNNTFRPFEMPKIQSAIDPNYIIKPFQFKTKQKTATFKQRSSLNWYVMATSLYTHSLYLVCWLIFPLPIQFNFSFACNMRSAYKIRWSNKKNWS